MMCTWEKLWHAAALLLVCSISSPQVLHALDRPSANSVWVTETEGAIWLSSSDGSIQAAIPGFTNVRGASLDVRRETLWLLADRALSTFDLSGNLQFSLALPVPDSSHAAVTVVPSSGAVWLGAGHDLLNVSAEGEVLGSFKLPADAVALGIDEQRSLLWVGTERSAEARDLVTGALINTISLAPSERLHDLSVELFGGRVWIAAGDEARLYEPDGTEVFSTPFKGLQHAFPAPYGGAWLADQKRIAHLSADGALDPPFEPLGGKGTIEHLVVSGEGTVWVATQNTIARVSDDGESVDRISFKPPIRIWDLATNTDWISPVVEIVSPPEHACVSESTPSIDLAFSDRGWGVDSSTLQIFTGQNLVMSSCTTAPEGASCRVLDALPDGELSLEAIVEDYAGNLSAPSRRTIVIDTIPPQIFVTEPPDGSVVGEPEVLISGTVSEPVELSVAGAQVPLGEDLDFSDVEVSLEEGPNQIEISAVDCAGNTSHRTLTVTYSPGSAGGLPPDPATVAPPLDPTVPTQLSEAVRFLYEGDQPIQTGVEPGTIDSARVAVIRGTVLRRDGAPLPGVEIRVHSHPELGETLSREDGAFDLAVNAGARLTLSYSKHGYLPVHRQVQTTWRDYATAEAVVLVPYDEQSTVINMGSSEVQVAQGSLSMDTDGTRQAVVIVPAGTAAELVLADGTTRSAPSLTMRATEYTVGPRGPESMPAPLPPTSGYTYAVDLSADEAVAAGATSVTFSQPVYHYVENFLGFPIGGAVPAGYYDRDLAVWVPSENGRIVQVLEVIEGRAVLDVDGSGEAATSTELADLQISDGELQRLGELYAAGQSLWRTPIPHFTPWDCNWPYGPPDDAEEPPEPDAQKPDPKDEEAEEVQDDDDPAEDEEDPACEAGSVIECENQVLGETIPLVGTAESLHYRSNRVPGRRVANVMKVRLSGRSVPASLDRIELRIEIAGQQIRRTFVAAPNQSYSFTWNGKDAYGRVVQGRRLATARVGYVYRAVYYEPGRFTSSFGEVSPRTQILGDRENLEVTLWRSSAKMLGTNLAAMVGLGGWTLSDHHIYQGAVTTRELYRGDGRMQIDGDPSSFDAVWESENEGRVLGPYGLAAAPDGGFYYVDLLPQYPAAPYQRVQKVGPNGEREGAVFIWHANDLPQVQVGPNGDAYVATCSGFVWGYIWNLTSGEQWSSQGTGCFNKFLVAPDGTFYYGRDELRHLRRNGTTTTVFASPVGRELAFRTIDQQGRIYVAVWATNRVWRIDPDGSARVVAGTGVRGFSGDGGPATAARLDFPEGLAIAPDGSLLIVDNGNARVRRVSPSGIITTIIGSGSTSRAAGPVHPLAAGLSLPVYLTATPDGRVLVGDSSGVQGAILETKSPFPGRVSVGQAAIASKSGSEVFIFDSAGRHLRTLNALTGATERTFGYDVNGKLISLADAFGNRTRIERDASGSPTAIIAPFGQQTELTVDAEGYLSSVTNPAGESYRFGYWEGGLLRSITDPAGHEKTAQYSTRGRLVSERDPEGGAKILHRWRTGAGQYRVELKTAEGRQTSYSRDRTIRGRKLRSTSTAGGAETQTVQDDDGSRVEELPSGAFVRALEGTDSRFGLQAPLTRRWEVCTPDGRLLQGSLEQDATLSSPGDPFSVTSLRASWSVNGRQGSALFDAVTGEITTTSPMGRTAVTVLNEQSRPKVVRPPAVEEIKYAYDARGRLVHISQGEDARKRELRLFYDDQGRLSRMVDPLDREVRLEYDPAGRVVGQTQPDGPMIRFEYDANGNLTSITPPGRPAHLFRYTAVNDVKEYKPPPLEPDPVATTYTYDRDHRLLDINRPDGQSIHVTYDLAGRVETISHPADVVTLSYEVGTSQLATVEGSEVGITYSYDGPLLTSISWGGTVEGTVAWSYDDNFWHRSQSVDDVSVTFDYDDDGLFVRAGSLTALRDTASTRITSTKIGAIASRFSYNSFGELASIESTSADVPLLSLSFDRDQLGRVKRKTETIEGLTQVFSYDYDATGRLGRVIRNGSTVEEYHYDDNGNRLAAVYPWGMQTAHYDAEDRLVTYGDAVLSHTLAGELATRTEGGSTTIFDYDFFGNLRRVTLPTGQIIEYVIDGRDRRVGKNVNGVLIKGFLYKDALNPVAELDGSGAVAARFVYGTRPNVPDYMIKNGTTFRLLADHLGSVRLVVDTESGAIAQRLDYDAFGRTILDTNPGFQPFGFAGGIYDSDTGFVRFGARDYDPKTGRWTTKDLLKFTSDETNAYVYATNDPQNFLDPLGQDAVMADSVDLLLLLTTQAAEGALDFLKNYGDMRDANTIGGDKYFHCLANCESSRQGAGGKAFAQGASGLREVLDFPKNIFHGLSPMESLLDCTADEAANATGRGGDPSLSCQQVCSGLRPKGLPPRF